MQCYGLSSWGLGVDHEVEDVDGGDGEEDEGGNEAEELA